MAPTLTLADPLHCYRWLGLTPALTVLIILGPVPLIGILLMFPTLLTVPGAMLVGESGMALRWALVVLIHPCGIMQIGLIVRRSRFRSAELSSRLAKLL